MILEWLLQLVSSDLLLRKLFLDFYSEVVSVFVTELGSLYVAKSWVLFCNQSVSLCLFIVELSPLILRDTKEKKLLFPIIFVVRVGILFLWLSSFRFVEGLLSSFF